MANPARGSVSWQNVAERTRWIFVGPLSAEEYGGAELHDHEKHDDGEYGKDQKLAHCRFSPR